MPCDLSTLFYLDFSDNLCYNFTGSCQARRRLTSLAPREGLFSPSISVEGGDAMYITYEELMLFCTFVVALISLVVKIYDDKKR